jgi:hypothetical protein
MSVAFDPLRYQLVPVVYLFTTGTTLVKSCRSTSVANRAYFNASDKKVLGSHILGNSPILLILHFFLRTQSHLALFGDLSLKHHAMVLCSLALHSKMLGFVRGYRTAGP